MTGRSFPEVDETRIAAVARALGAGGASADRAARELDDIAATAGEAVSAVAVAEEAGARAREIRRVREGLDSLADLLAVTASAIADLRADHGRATAQVAAMDDGEGGAGVVPASASVDVERTRLVADADRAADEAERELTSCAGRLAELSADRG